MIDSSYSSCNKAHIIFLVYTMFAFGNLCFHFLLLNYTTRLCTKQLLCIWPLCKFHCCLDRGHIVQRAGLWQWFCSRPALFDWFSSEPFNISTQLPPPYPAAYDEECVRRLHLPACHSECKTRQMQDSLILYVCIWFWTLLEETLGPWRKIKMNEILAVNRSMLWGHW